MISVVVPVYNTGMYLEDCINSILMQDFTNIEIIVIDDGSRDEVTLDVCDKLKYKDERIRVVHQANAGTAGARNRGVQEAKGDYICFIDSDDTIEKNMLAVLYELIRKYSVKISFCGMYIDNNKKIIRPDEIQSEQVLSVEEFLHYFLLGNNHSSCTVLYHKTIFEKHQFVLGETNEDFLFNFKAVLDEKYVAVTPQKLYHYVKREGSVTTVSTNVRSLDWLNHVKDIQDIMKKRIEFNKLEQEIDYQYLYCNIVLCNKAILSMAGGQKGDALVVYKKAAEELKGKRDRICNNQYLAKRNQMIGIMISIVPRIYMRVATLAIKMLQNI